MISIVNLQEYLHNLEEAKKRDHRRLGQQQELFFFHDLRWCHGLTIFCMHYMVVRFVLKIAAGLFISDLSVYSLFFTMLNVSVQGAVSFYRMGQGSTTSCNHLSGKNTRKEVMKRCKYSSFLSVVHSTNYSSNSWLIYVCLWHLLSQAGLSDDPILVVYMWRLYWQGWCGVHRLFLPTCSTCSYGKHLVMLPTTKKICLPLRFATSSLTFIVSQ